MLHRLLFMDLAIRRRQLWFTAVLARYDEHKWTIAQFAIGLFRFYDQLKVGYITKEQYDEGCVILDTSGNTAYEPWAQEAFESYDCVNADGYVTMDEFMQYILVPHSPPFSYLVPNGHARPCAVLVLPGSRRSASTERAWWASNGQLKL